MKINQIPPQLADFTEVLTTIALTPNMLYFYGKMPENVFFDTKKGLQRLRCMAIVGARKNTRYGEEVAYRAAYEAAKAGAVVISGLAYGIDSIAHRGALDAGGITVAVLGTPINDVYPRRHVGLAREIIEKGGCVMSEYGPGEAADSGGVAKTRFLARNRLISGLSDVVLVAEAAEKSGSLNTAMHALEQGRDLMAVPGDITRPMSQGCNKLIRQGAMPYTEPQDLLDLLFPAAARPRQKKLPLGDNPVEVAIIRLLDDGVNDGEEIVSAGGLSVAEFNQAITMLEIRGVVRSLGANRWHLR